MVFQQHMPLVAQRLRHVARTFGRGVVVFVLVIGNAVIKTHGLLCQR